jgi:hypothetical protein
MSTEIELYKWADKLIVDGKIWHKVGDNPGLCVVYAEASDVTTQPEPEPKVRYMTPIPGKYHLSEPLEGEVWVYTSEPWEAACLVAISCNKETNKPYIVHDLTQWRTFRFKEFGPNNPPPVDMPVLIDQELVRYFSHFDSEGYLHFFHGGSTSLTNQKTPTIESDNYSFVDIDGQFPEAWVRYVEAET